MKKLKNYFKDSEKVVRPKIGGMLTAGWDRCDRMEYVLQTNFPLCILFLRHILFSRLYCSVYNLSQLISKRLPSK